MDDMDDMDDEVVPRSQPDDFHAFRKTQSDAAFDAQQKADMDAHLEGHFFHTEYQQRMWRAWIKHDRTTLMDELFKISTDIWLHRKTPSNNNIVRVLDLQTEMLALLSESSDEHITCAILGTIPSLYSKTDLRRI